MGFTAGPTRECTEEKRFSLFVRFWPQSTSNPLGPKDKSYYTILHLRNCNRGAPLLPVRPGAMPTQSRPEESGWVVVTDDDGIGSCWTRWTDQEFTFYLYLEEFLRRLDIQLRLYSELNGRALVPYQVAVRTLEWSSCRQHLEPAFHRQQRAYRRLNGGVSAPRIGEAPAARFQVRAPHMKKPCFASASTDVVVRRTFLKLDRVQET